MGGVIWIESEGLDKGSTASFIVKLGICDNPNDSSVHPVAPRGRAHNGSGDLPGHKLVFRDTEDVASSSSRYQRSL
jgi:ethylene receptor